MLKSNSSAFNPISTISVEMKKASTQLIKSIAQKQIAPVSLLAVLSFASVSWVTLAVIVPEKAQAYTARVDVSLNRQSDETFDGFLRRAETVARAAAQRSFDGDILVSDVAVTVLGQNDGAIAPILLLEVSRQSWKNRPDPQHWATYFPNTESLLGFERPGVVPGTQPTAATAPPPAPTPFIGVPGAPIPDSLTPPNPDTTPRQGAPIPDSLIPQPGVPGTPGTPGIPATPNATGTGVPTTSPTATPIPNNLTPPATPAPNPVPNTIPNATVPAAPTTNPATTTVPSSTTTPGNTTITTPTNQPRGTGTNPR